MRWTKQHSANAVAAKRRLRILRATQVLDDICREIHTPRKTKPDFKILIESKSGERIKISATRFNGWLITNEGIKTPNQIAKGIALILKNI